MHLSKVPPPRVGAAGYEEIVEWLERHIGLLGHMLVSSSLGIYRAIGIFQKVSLLYKSLFTSPSVYLIKLLI